ncbi:hypothetical protein [Desmospora activa]|uniref:Uncharacterized protein n=1 Tax=Desmospora activa DSM 45169 TaxID=1121389 RepID=A0A2T4ZBY5_9BACL|nr:hypothetical protein [Desmospora activa]PTM59410.1 hypothetical protein C8J48_2029 [Desmospora activa DSM 45169]
MGIKKMKTVTFDMSNPQERELFMVVERNPVHFSDWVKKLLFQQIYGRSEPTSESSQDHGEAIRNSGLPFG